MDTIALADRIAAIVIDYKLSGRPINYDRLFYGLNLQLVTYLLVLAALGETWVGIDVAPAAAFYVTLARKIARVDHPDDAAEPDSLEFRLATANKARGIIDEAFADSLDALDPGERSLAYAIRKNKNVEPIGLNREDVISRQAFVALIEWSRRKLADLADQIIGGEIAVRPYRHGTQTPCPHCEYRPTCRLDLAFNRYEHVESLKSERLRIIVEEAGR